MKPRYPGLSRVGRIAGWHLCLHWNPVATLCLTTLPRSSRFGSPSTRLPPAWGGGPGRGQSRLGGMRAAALPARHPFLEGPGFCVQTRRPGPPAFLAGTGRAPGWRAGRGGPAGRGCGRLGRAWERGPRKARGGRGGRGGRDLASLSLSPRQAPQVRVKQPVVGAALWLRHPGRCFLFARVTGGRRGTLGFRRLAPRQACGLRPRGPQGSRAWAGTQIARVRLQRCHGLPQLSSRADPGLG